MDSNLYRKFYRILRQTILIKIQNQYLPQLSKQTDSDLEESKHGSSNLKILQNQLQKAGRISITTEEKNLDFQSYRDFSGKSKLGVGLAQIDWKYIDELLEQREDQELERYLDNLQLRIVNLKDDKYFTLMHHAVLKQSMRKIKFLSYYARTKQYESDKSLKEFWFDGLTRDKFTPLHFAAYKGNIRIIQYLMQQGCNPLAENQNGLGMLHVASQGDAASSIYYFTQELGLNINVKDHRGSTPLHWACYSQSEIALSYIVPQGADINIQDSEGYTPLHLAVKSVESLKSTRPVREKIQEIMITHFIVFYHKGRLPQDLISEVKNEYLHQQLIQMLVGRNRFGFLMLSTPVGPVKTNSQTLFFCLFLHVYTFLLTILFIFPRYSLYLNLPCLFLLLLTMLLFTLSCKHDPGYLKTPQVSFTDLLIAFDPTQLCPDCKLIRTLRSKHCVACNRCVERFDHHCPWINNCVGIGNHNYFLTYIIAQVCLIIYVFTITVIALVQETDQDIQEYAFYWWEFQINHIVFLVCGINIALLSGILILPLMQGIFIILDFNLSDQFYQREDYKREIQQKEKQWR